jgi:hypothetical protein
MKQVVEHRTGHQFAEISRICVVRSSECAQVLRAFPLEDDGRVASPGVRAADSPGGGQCVRCCREMDVRDISCPEARTASTTSSTGWLTTALTTTPRTTATDTDGADNTRHNEAERPVALRIVRARRAVPRAATLSSSWLEDLGESHRSRTQRGTEPALAVSHARVRHRLQEAVPNPYPPVDDDHRTGVGDTAGGPCSSIGTFHAGWHSGHHRW